MSLEIRSARPEELERVNDLRRMVNRLHVQGRPDIFRPGFCEELQRRLYVLYDEEPMNVIVAANDGAICGFAIVSCVQRPESVYNLARAFYHVEEIGVSEECRRLGVASALVDYMKRDARSRGLDRIELDVWAFNGGALEFYENAGFSTYRRFMELRLD